MAIDPRQRGEQNPAYRPSDAFYEASGPGPKTIAAAVHGVGQLPVEHICKPFDPPNLTHTKVTFADVGPKTIESPNWNSILDEVVKLAYRQLGGFEELRSAVFANIVHGSKTDDGYHYLREENISIQGQSVNDAWRSIAHLASRVGCRVTVKFFWRQKEGAQRPGQGGSFSIAARG